MSRWPFRTAAVETKSVCCPSIRTNGGFNVIWLKINRSAENYAESLGTFISFFFFFFSSVGYNRGRLTHHNWHMLHYEMRRPTLHTYGYYWFTCVIKVNYVDARVSDVCTFWCHDPVLVWRTVNTSLTCRLKFPRGRLAWRSKHWEREPLRPTVNPLLLCLCLCVCLFVCLSLSVSVCLLVVRQVFDLVK